MIQVCKSIVAEQLYLFKCTMLTDRNTCVTVEEDGKSREKY